MILPLLLLAAHTSTASPARLDREGLSDALRASEHRWFAGAYLQSYVGYRAEWRGALQENAFELDRLELGAAVGVSGVAAVVASIDTIRSAGPASFQGIDGDAIVVRARTAYALAALDLGPISLSASAGLVPDLWIEALEAVHPLRAVGPSAAERIGAFSPSDLGGSVELGGFGGRLRLTAALTNGEGIDQVERNAGKNLSVLLRGVPLEFAFLDRAAQVSLALFYRDGSLGFGSARAHRLGAALALSHPRGGLALELDELWGLRDRAEVHGRAFSASAWAMVLAERLGAFARVQRLDENLDLAGAGTNRLDLGVIGMLAASELGLRVRLFIGYQGERAGTSAGPVPGVPAAVSADRLMLTLDAAAALTTGVRP